MGNADYGLKLWFIRLPLALTCGVLGRCQIATKKSTQPNMQIATEAPSIEQKTRELCQAILEQPNMVSIRKRIDTFMADDRAREQYDGLMAKGQALQQKQQMSVQLTGEEINDFEQHRDSLLKNPVTRGFLDAQEELHQVQETIHSYVNKTLELGRMPTEDDLSGGGCGHGCGCHH